MFRTTVIGAVAAALAVLIAAPANAAMNVHRGGTSTTLLYVSQTSNAGLWGKDINDVVVPAIHRVNSGGGSYTCTERYAVEPTPTRNHRTDIQQGVRLSFVGNNAVVHASRNAPRGQRLWDVIAWCADIPVHLYFLTWVK